MYNLCVQNPYVIVTAADENYSHFLLAQLCSIEANIKYSVKFYILTNGLGNNTKAAIKRRAFSNIDIRYIDIRKEIEKFQFYPKSLPPHYWRLMAPHILREYEKILYLDVDTIVRKDISDLFTTNLRNNTVGACQDYLKYVRTAVSNWDKLNLNPERVYFNSGVLLINPESFIRKKIAKKVIRLSQLYPEYHRACGLWEQYDQYGLNIALDNNFLILPQKFNHGSIVEDISAHIVHFIGDGKPWLDLCHPIYRKEYYYYLGQAHGELV